MKSFKSGNPLKIRNPKSVRPWQHVMDPLSGYLILCEKLWSNPKSFSGAWNFGPLKDSIKSVESIVSDSFDLWGESNIWEKSHEIEYHEANILQLSSKKSNKELNWYPLLDYNTSLELTINWYKNYYSKNANSLQIILSQIDDYLKINNG